MENYIIKDYETEKDYRKITDAVVADPEVQKERIKMLKSLLYTATDQTNVKRMRSIPSICEFMVTSDKLGYPFFSDVFHYLAFRSHAETVCDGSYKQLVELVADDLELIDASVILRPYIIKMPEFQKFVNDFLGRRTAPQEAYVAYLSNDPKSSALIDEFEEHMDKAGL